MDSLKNLSDISFMDSLKDIGIHVVDIETTGLDLKKDRPFSAAAHSYTLDTSHKLSSPSKTEGFFNVLDPNKTRKASSFKSNEKYIEYLENRLMGSHSEISFGMEQKDRGSLREVAEAYASANTQTPEQFLQNLNSKLSQNQGNLLLTHNSNFEQSMFEAARNRNPSEGVYKQLQAGNLHNSLNVFKVSSQLSDYGSGLTNQASATYFNDVLHYANNGTPEQLQKSLGKYASDHVNVLNQMQSEIQQAKLTGKTVAMDTMHMSRALMAFGAVNGVVDVHNLLAGDKVEHQAQHFLNQQELHTASGDSKQQASLFEKFSEEIDKYKADPNYKSTMFKEYNDYLNQNRVGLTNIKSSINREVKDVIQGVKEPIKFYDYREKVLKRANILPEADKKEALDYIDKINQHFEDRDPDTKKAIKDLKQFDTDYNFSATSTKKTIDIEETINKASKTLSSKKGVIGIVAALGAGNLLLGGGEKGKDKRANTYNEVYDNMYFGTPLADWQERNNSHKVLY